MATAKPRGTQLGPKSDVYQRYYLKNGKCGVAYCFNSGHRFKAVDKYKKHWLRYHTQLSPYYMCPSGPDCGCTYKTKTGLHLHMKNKHSHLPSDLLKTVKEIMLENINYVAPYGHPISEPNPVVKREIKTKAEYRGDGYGGIKRERDEDRKKPPQAKSSKKPKVEMKKIERETDEEIQWDEYSDVEDHRPPLGQGESLPILTENPRGFKSIAKSTTKMTPGNKKSAAIPHSSTTRAGRKATLKEEGTSHAPNIRDKIKTIQTQLVKCMEVTNTYLQAFHSDLDEIRQSLQNHQCYQSTVKQ